MAKKVKKEKKFINLGEWEVLRAREVKRGTFFTLKFEGGYLPNLRVVPAGKKYEAFISMPQTKGSDGNYYDDYTIYFAPEDMEAIIEAVEEAIE